MRRRALGISCVALLITFAIVANWRSRRPSVEVAARGVISSVTSCDGREFFKYIHDAQKSAYGLTADEVDAIFIEIVCEPLSKF